MYLAKMYEWEDQREGLRSVMASVTLDRPVTGQTLACLLPKHVVRLGGDAGDAAGASA